MPECDATRPTHGIHFHVLIIGVFQNNVQKLTTQVSSAEPQRGYTESEDRSIISIKNLQACEPEGTCSCLWGGLLCAPLLLLVDDCWCGSAWVVTVKCRCVCVQLQNMMQRNTTIECTRHEFLLRIVQRPAIRRASQRCSMPLCTGACCWIACSNLCSRECRAVLPRCCFITLAMRCLTGTTPA